jgi:iron complex outermembrane receptor protein
MSELINKNDNRATIRWKLLTGVSALALTSYISSASVARAEDSGQPQIWIELGGQLSHLDDGQETFAPVFPNSPARPSIFSPSQKFEGTPLYSIDETGKISFEPEYSNWVFSASIRYGRSARKKDAHQQTYPVPTHFHFSSGGVVQTIIPYSGTPDAARFVDTQVRNSEHHLILDFQAGKDIGLGMFGANDGSSVVSVGVRFAQFSSNSNIALKSDPDWHRHYKYVNYPSAGINNEKLVTGQLYHSNAASIRATRSFHGVGPSISWNASAPIAGNPKDGELLFDWGVNAALLFGRQKALVHHQATAQYRPAVKYGHRYVVSHYSADPPARARSVTVPNLGGFAGLSFRIQDFKLSAGYRADFFFNAVDGGIDTRKNESRGFYGPFASISVGLGD